ncbi:4'-phosphopantetheinyl transferase superfamily protein [Acinetobacter lactucae]|uniref:4'-phosphopantetheinyl transferase family protein n=1 Tax=Acinetobacter calcoaceticus/baumannii complex TaxID=909768 RepID=UPI001EFDB572|nr:MULTISPECIES: 4'-phosphopantetheinyl transferase superfamily protein [Acinetobacter calcoaceticus/baumannii complex]MCG9510273.1 4'-phosphopantetheinyl transferase superfamily protein [Acinetobacter pittii]MCU4346999.1 4'-phosphopantetheinyl transferase superfamily protein [Acinetobacter lactucae]
MNTEKQLSRGANSYLDEINIQYEKLTAFGLEIHKVQLSQIKEIFQLDHIYQELNIFLPPNIKSSRFIRQLEFLTGRLAAKYALQSLNLQDSIIYQGKHGEPLWPEDVMGGISHVGSKKSCHAIAYARNNTVKEKTFGIDIESQKHYVFFKKKDEFYDVFLNKNEQAEIEKLQKKQAYLYLVIFSAKESIIKAIYLKYKQIIDFKSIKFKQLDGEFIYFHLRQESLIEINLKVKVQFFYTNNEIITISCIEN